MNNQHLMMEAINPIRLLMPGAMNLTNQDPNKTLKQGKNP